jgi:hypothetical protein
MKILFALFVTLMLATLPVKAIAQTQEDQEAQQACQDDVFALCGEQVPDRDRIEACLRQKWHQVSRACRTVMVNYGKKHRDSRNR